MKLEYLYLDKYKGLRNVRLYFQQQNTPVSINFLIGKNGSGKSSLLEAIGMIFTRILQGETPGFDFEVIYSMPDGTRIKAMPEREKYVAAGLCVEIEKQREIVKTNQIPQEYLPDRIISYCSGANQSMEELLLKSNKEALEEELYDLSLQESEEADGQKISRLLTYREQLESNPRALSLDAVTSKFVLPVLFSVLPVKKSREGQKEELWSYCKLREMLVKRICVEMFPSAFSIRVNREALEQSDDIPQLNILRRLLGEGAETAADYTNYGWSADQVGEEGNLSEESVSVFLFQTVEESIPTSYFQPALQEFFEGNPFMFLSVLLTAYDAGVINRIEFLYKAGEREGLYNLEAFSDGELMWLARTGLVLMAQSYCGENTLFLYDEPDVHFNDDWNKDFMKILYELSKNTKHQFLIATHSTLLLTDARYEQVHVFQQIPGEDTIVSSAEISTFAAQRDEIAREIFDASDIGSYARESVQQMMEEKDKEKMKENISKLGPGFQRFRLYEQYYEMFDQPLE